MPPFLTDLSEPSSWRRPPAVAARDKPPPRVRLAATVAVAFIVAQAAFAQVSLALTVVFVVIAVASRWRPVWLLGPGLAGLAWAAVAGPGAALDGYLAGAGHLGAVLARQGSLAADLRGFGAVAAGWRHWLPGQIPLALVVAAAEAGVVSRLAGRRQPRRPGLVVTARRRYLLATLRRGEVATADGGCLGVMTRTGLRAAVSWREAEGGVLVTGADRAAVSGTCRNLATAAILHRKSVIIVDLTDGAIAGAEFARSGRGTLQAAVEGACGDAGAPLAIFGPGRECYEPFPRADRDAAIGLLATMLGWCRADRARRELWHGYARAGLELIAAGATPSGAAWPRGGLLEDLAALLGPGEVRLPADPVLRRLYAAFDSKVRADPAAAAAMAAQLGMLTRSAVGAVLRGVPSGAGQAGTISLARALAERQVVFFPLDATAHGQAAIMIARLVAADLARALTARGGAAADCLLWINGCDDGDLGRTVVVGSEHAGVATLLSTASAPLTQALAGQLNVVTVRGRPPPGLGVTAAPASRAGLTGESSLSHQDSQVLPRALLADGGADALALAVRGPVPRLVTGCRAVR